MNPLEQNPAARRIAYQVFWIVSLVVGCVQIGFATAKADTPTWLLVTLSVLPFLGSAIGYTAQANVAPTTKAETPPADRGYVDEPREERGAYDGTGILLAIACIVIIVCGIIWLLGR